MMNWLQALFLGVVQGFTEFLPVSSSGHLAIFQKMFGLYDTQSLQSMMLMLDTALHIGTLFAVFVALREDVVSLLKKPFQSLTLSLVLATIPAVVATLLFGDFFDQVFSGKFLGYTGYCFLATSAILFMTPYLRPGQISMERMGVARPLLIGLTQAFAIFPGVSRSGSTIFGGLAVGIKREEAARFSFLMSVVAIVGSAVLQGKDIVEKGFDATLGSLGVVPVLVGMAAAAVSGYFALRFVIDLVKKGKLWVFGIYTTALGILVLVDFYVTHLVF